MRACTRCESPLPTRLDDGTGKHRDGCPTPPDRATYLARRARTLPRLIRLHEFLRDGGDPRDLLREEYHERRLTEVETEEDDDE